MREAEVRPEWEGRTPAPCGAGVLNAAGLRNMLGAENSGKGPHQDFHTIEGLSEGGDI